MRARALAAAGAVAMAIGAAGCGSSSSESAQQAAPPTATSSASAPQAPATTARVTTESTPRAAPTTASVPAVDPNAPEVNAAGDIPDDQVFVAYWPPGAGYSVSVPEGWARTARAGAVTFTDKLNAIRLESRAAAAAPTVASVTAKDVPALARTVAGYRAGDVTTVTRSAGTAVRITYLAASPRDPVTGTTRTDAVERYIFFRRGRDAVLTLSGPQGADNVDPWMIVSDSLTWAR